MHPSGRFILLATLFATLLARRPLSAADNPLASVRSFMYQLQDLETPAAIDALARSPYDLLIVEPTFTMTGDEHFDASALVAKLKAGKPGRLVVAYIDIGEAEDFRTYWPALSQSAKATKGKPAVILGPDPDGWQNDFSVAFWDPRWQSIWLGENGLLKQVMAAGFDGVYLDWVEAYDEKAVVAEARKQKVNPTAAMVDFIAAIRRQVLASQPRGVVIAQNAPDLIDDDPRYAALIDGVGFEDTWFSGAADAAWDDPKGGDIANRGKGEDSPAGRLLQYRKFQRAGLAVFTIDYCLQPQNAARVYAEAARAGLIPLVTRVSLERLTTTPPPGLP